MQHCSILQDHDISTRQYIRHCSHCRIRWTVWTHLVSLSRNNKYTCQCSHREAAVGPRVSACMWRLCAVCPPQWPGCGARRGAGCRYVDIATRADTWSVLLSIFNLAYNSLLSIKLFGFLNIYLLSIHVIVK